MQRPVPAADARNAADADGAPTLKLLLAAIALVGLLGGAVFLVMEIVRRRTYVLSTVRDPNLLPFEAPPEDVRDDEVHHRCADLCAATADGRGAAQDDVEWPCGASGKA